MKSLQQDCHLKEDRFSSIVALCVNIVDSIILSLSGVLTVNQDKYPQSFWHQFKHTNIVNHYTVHEKM